MGILAFKADGRVKNQHIDEDVVERSEGRKKSRINSKCRGCQSQ